MIALVAIALLLFARRSDDPSTSMPEVVSANSNAAQEPPSIAATSETVAGALSDRTAIADRDAALADPAMTGRTIRVRVLDYRLEPAAGVSVRLSAESGVRKVLGGLIESTDKDGVAALHERDFESVFGTVHSDATFRIEAELVRRDRLEKRLRLDELFGDPLEFVLPPLGAIEVAMVRDGKAVTEPMTVDLEPTLETHLAIGVLEGHYGWNRSRTLRANVVNGVARFPWIEPGLGFFAIASVDGERIPSSEPFSGPRAPAELAKFVFELDRGPYFAFRIFGPDGNVLAKQSIYVNRTERFPDGGSTATGDDFGTDEAGRVTVRWPEPWKESATRTLEITFRDERQTVGNATVSIDVSRKPISGKNELGDVVLVALPVLVMGQVLDPRGNGVAGARIWFGKETDLNVGILADASGRFTIRGSSSGGSMSLMASGSGLAPSEPTMVESGQTGIVLRLRAGGSLIASVRRPKDLEARFVNARLIAAESWARGDRDLAPRQRAKCADDDTLEFHDLVPGNYVFLLKAGHLDPVLMIENVVVTADQVSRDLRLQGIELEEYLAAVDVTVVDASDRPVLNAEVKPIDQYEPACRRVRDGVFRVVLDARGETILASAPGFRTTVVEEVKKDIRVVLQRSITVVIRATGDDPLVNGARSMQLQFAPDKSMREGRPSASPPFSSGSRVFTAARTATLQLNAPGHYELKWFVSESGLGGSAGTNVGAAMRIEVLESAEVQTFEFAVPKGALDDPGG